MLTKPKSTTLLDVRVTSSVTFPGKSISLTTGTTTLPFFITVLKISQFLRIVKFPGSSSVKFSSPSILFYSAEVLFSITSLSFEPKCSSSPTFLLTTSIFSILSKLFLSPLNATVPTSTPLSLNKFPVSKIPASFNRTSRSA